MDKRAEGVEWRSDCSREEGNMVSKGVLAVAAEFGGWIWNVDDPKGYLIYHLNR